MVAERSGRPRGWYPDPTDPTSVRHWDGDRWERARTRPAWDVSAGDLVVDVEGRFDTSGPWEGPAVEGPVRPAPDRAAAGALGVGSESVRGQTRPAPLGSGAGSGGSRAGHFPPVGARRDVAPRPPWTSSRRPLVAFVLVAVVALVAVAASVVGRPSRPPTQQAPVPSGFVTQASRGCATMLGTRRPSALPTDLAALGAEVAQITTLTGSLRTMATITGAGDQTAGWLAGWQRFTVDEQDRATALGTQPPSSPGPAPDASTLARRALAEAGTADRFAMVNGLQACTILARGPASGQLIPS